MKRINEDIRTGNFKRIYLLYGEERYLRRQYRERLKKALCDGQNTMNVHFYGGADLPVKEMIDQAEVFPFFAERRVIFIDDSGLFKSGGESLAEYLSAYEGSACFVFNESEVDKRSKLYKTVQSKGCAVEFKTQEEDTLKRWIAGILKKEGKLITEGTAELFLEKTGTDMENISSELEKLVSYCLDKKVIENEDVEAVCAGRAANHIFDMVSAIADGYSDRALSLYNELVALKEPPMRILYLIARQYSLLLQAKEMRDRGFDNRAIASRLGLPPFIAGKYVAQSRRFRTAQLKEAVADCVEAEEAVKSGKMNDVMSVEVLILSMLRKKS